MPTSKANRPTQGDGEKHRLLGPDHLRLQRCELAREMLALIVAEIRSGEPLSPVVIEAIDRAYAGALHLAEILRRKYPAPVQPSIYQTMGQQGEV